MSAPLKPWERAGINTRSSTLSFDGTTRLPLGAGGPRLNALRNSGDMDTHSSQSTSRTKAPPLPPRPQTQRSNGGLMYGGSRYGYGGNMYGGYNSIYGGGFGGHGMYGGGYGGGYGGYGLGMNRFGSPFNQSGSSSFVGRAEESSRAAFQSIESIVQAFGSVAMMLESTHFAMHNTFTAVLSMADHFSRLRAHLVSVLGAFTLFRAIRYIFRKIRALLGLATNQGLEEELWDNAATDVSSSGCEGGNSKKPISWPILLFFGVVLGTPLIIWKLLQSLMNDESSTKDWKTGEGDHVIARAEYDFDGEGEEELSFRAGNILRLAPKGKQPRIRGWLLGTVDGSTEGIVPANYVKILGLRRRKKQVRESKQDSSQEQCGISEANLGQEFVKEEDKADGNGLISSQDLITEETLNEETLADSELLDSDLRSLNEGQN